MDNEVIMTFFKIMAVGAVVMIGYIVLDNYFVSKEFPDLSYHDSIENEMILSVKTSRSASYVEFQNGRKYKISWGQNLNYDEGFQSIAEVIFSDDLVSKKANSDTIIIRHRGGEYTFVVEQLIKKQVGH